jgi:hypothetical protein
MSQKSHICIVLTNEVCKNMNDVIKELTNKCFDVGCVERSWSLMLLNRNDETVMALRTLIKQIPQCGKNVFELKNHDDEWDRDKKLKEVYMILPDKVIEEKIHILIDTKIETLNNSHKQIRYIWVPWKPGYNITPFMENLIVNNKRVCDGMRSTIFDEEALKNLFPIDTWNMLNEKISRKMMIVDIARYNMIWKLGGVYLDTDVRMNSNMRFVIDKALSEDKRMVLFTEIDNCNPLYMGSRENKNYTQRIYNCVVWALPGETFWKDCVELAIERCNTLVNENVTEFSDTDILWATGPDVVSTIYHSKYKNYEHLLIYDHTESVKIASHLNAGTWRDNKDKK